MARLMVPHVLRSVASLGVGHPVWMKGILAFERPEVMMFLGGVPREAIFSCGFVSVLSGYAFPVEGLVSGWVLMLRRAW